MAIATTTLAIIMIEQINRWFNQACPYQEGVELYLTYGTNAGLKTILQFGENNYNASKLQEALEELRDQAQLKADANAVVTEEKRQDSIWKTPEMQALTRERNVLHNQLSALPGQSDRYRVAHRIMRLTDKIEKKAGIYDPDPDPEQEDTQLPIDRAALHKKLMSNRAYISKNRHREDKVHDVATRKKVNEEIEKLLKDG